MNQKSYQTFSENVICCEIIEQGSKFIAYPFTVKTEEEIKQRLDLIKSNHPKASHWCYAWRLGSNENLYRFNDDGEPSGTAGKPIFNQLNKYNLTNALIVVVRYFGGTLLGTSGLLKAYKNAAEKSILSNSLIALEENSDYSLESDPVNIQILIGILKELKITIMSLNLSEHSIIRFRLISHKEEDYFRKIKSRFEKIPLPHVENPLILRSCIIRKTGSSI